MKRIISAILCCITLLCVMSGCGYTVSFNVTKNNASSMSSQDIISTIETQLENNHLQHNVREESNDTLFVGIPTDLSTEGIEQNMDASQKLEVKTAVGWSDLKSNAQSLNESIMKLIQGSKYKHMELDVYNQTGSFPYLLYKDGVIEYDILE